MTEINNAPAQLALVSNYSWTRLHYRDMEQEENVALCDTDAMPVKVTALPASADAERMPMCQRCVAIARRRGLLHQEA